MCHQVDCVSGLFVNGAITPDHDLCGNKNKIDPSGAVVIKG